MTIGAALALFSPWALAGTQTGISALLNSPLTLFFITTNALLTFYFVKVRFNRFAIVHGPEILTTVGIFGCFLGIALALLKFDSTNLSHSVPNLLDGIKTAFWASVTGVGGALVIRIKHQQFKGPIPQESGGVKAASLDDLVTATEALKRGLVGDDEGTLLTQLKLMRQESKDQANALKQSFDDFAKHMVENNQKALIEALKQVISDFNQKLNEQFGENFKQLNAAVEKLVIWQQQYKEELETIKAYQQRASEDMRVATASFEEIVKKSTAIIDVATRITPLLETIDKQIKVIQEQETALHDALSNMKTVTPEFKAGVDSLLNELKTGVASIQLSTAGIVTNFGTQLQSANAEMKNLLTQVLKDAQKDFHESLADNSKVIKEGVLALDKGLQTELNEALDTLGRQLASLSQKFVSDYEPLTNRLRDVVRIASGV